jgi:ribonuclease D
MAVIPSDPIWVNNDEELQELCQRWSEQGALAIDTEFMRSSTFYPQTALFQVGDGQGCYLIDPLIIEDFEPFKNLMVNPDVTKVLHSCSEDLEVFQTFLEVVPTPLFDTQIAAAYVGLGFSLGYAKLIECLLNVSVPKDETRSDWLQRPLSQSQMQYAALDVAYLMVAYGVLLKKLKANRRLSWIQEDCAEIVTAAEEPVHPELFYTKIKSAWKLNRRELAVLQALTRWREIEARARNVPRNRLVKERALWDMARIMPTELKHLTGLEGMTPRMIKADGEQLLELIEEARHTQDDQCPPRIPKPLSADQGDLMKALKQTARDIAESLDIAPEVLVRKRDFEDLVRSGMADRNAYVLNQRLSGWRRDVVGDVLLSQAQEWGLAASENP